MNLRPRPGTLATVVTEFEQLASFGRCWDRMQGGWGEFCERRSLRLRERERYGHAAERATEQILDDLFTVVLDWSLGDLNHQVGYADLLITRLGIKHLIVEAKAPGTLAWSRPSVERALAQAMRYAAEQKVKSVAVCDGYMLYAADVVDGSLRDRTFIALDRNACERDLWWLSVDGIYRVPDGAGVAHLQIHGEPEAAATVLTAEEEATELLHPKYGLPASCFAYVGDPNDPHRWALPFRLREGEIDTRRLPKAIQSILTNYRGAHVTRIPEAAIPDVLVRLAEAAAQTGKMPWQAAAAGSIYRQLEEALDQLSRLDELRQVAPSPLNATAA